MNRKSVLALTLFTLFTGCKNQLLFQPGDEGEVFLNEMGEKIAVVHASDEDPTFKSITCNCDDGTLTLQERVIDDNGQPTGETRDSGLRSPDFAIMDWRETFKEMCSEEIPQSGHIDYNLAKSAL